MAGLQKILLVEDNRDLSQIYRQYLINHGYTVAVAQDGDEALKVAKEFSPDLVFLDIMMPKRDGYEVLQLLRHDEQYNCTHSRIVMLTNLADSSKMSNPAIQKDLDGYAVKSEIVLDDLGRVIESFSTPSTGATP